jgi:hypothetical protein
VGGTSCIEAEGQTVNKFVDRSEEMGWEYAWDNCRSHVDTWTTLEVYYQGVERSGRETESCVFIACRGITYVRTSTAQNVSNLLLLAQGHTLIMG